MMLLRRVHVLNLLFAVGGAHLLAQAPESIGIVRSVSGPVILTTAVGAAAKQQVRLTQHSVSRRLFDGDTVQADPQGEVTVVISGRTRTIKLKGNQTIQLHPDHPVTEAELRLDSAIKNFGAAGASRQASGLIWWPADEGSVRAHGLQIRWNPSPISETYNFSLSKIDGDPIWTSGPINSSHGSLTPALNAAIEKLLLTNQSETIPQSYSLTVSSPSLGEVRTTFSVISKSSEARVEEELHQWDSTQSDPLLRSLGRAATLKAANLTCELAEEYQAALHLAPQSTALLHAALAADRATGNVARSRELAARLQNELANKAQDTGADKP